MNSKLCATLSLLAILALAAPPAVRQAVALSTATRVILDDGAIANDAPLGTAANPLATTGAPSTVGDGLVTGGFTGTPTITSGGSGYVSGDVGKTVNLVGGTNTTPAQVTISSLSGGAVATITVATRGVYSATPANAVATTGGGTTGAGLTLTASWAPAAQTLFAGVAPVNGWKVANPNSSGDLWASDNGVAPTANGASSYRVTAAGGQAATVAGEKPAGSPAQLLGTTIGQVFIARRW